MDLESADVRTAVALHRFLVRYHEDLNCGAVRPLEEYQALFPGHEEAIARRFVEIERGPEGEKGLGSAEATARRLGSYRLLEELGRGGQAVVYLAEDLRLHRRVALKVLLPGVVGGREGVARFRREAEAASRLDHPGICSVYEAGEEDGAHFIAMRYVEGETLSRRIARARQGAEASARPSSVTLREEKGPEGEEGERGSSSSEKRRELGLLLQFFERAARALHAAHQAGVVHRDIKPANLMVTPSGEPVILDFGLAWEEEASHPSLTRPGDFFGTPAYMAPEQVMGGPGRTDPRADVWALGVSLYEALTLQRPFEAPTREALYRSILSETPPDVRRLGLGLPRDLQVILETALAKERGRRYQSALALAEDLRRVRASEPIQARAAGPLLKLRYWARRSPGAAAGLLGVLLSLSAGLLAALLLLGEAREARDLADLKAQEAWNHLEAWERLADGRRLEDLQREAEEDLWPAVPEKVAAMETWISQAEVLAARLGDHAAFLAKLRRQAKPYSEADAARDAQVEPETMTRLTALEARVEMARKRLARVEIQRDEIVAARAALAERGDLSPREEQRLEWLDDQLAEAATWQARIEDQLQAVLADKEEIEEETRRRRTWSFADPREQLQHDRLQEAVEGLRELQGEPGLRRITILGMKSRLEFARTLTERTVVAWTTEWTAARERVAANPLYAGLNLVLQQGLVPLGPDPVSGLEEFCDTATGEIPERGTDGQLRITEESALVLVLIPGGSFLMGATPPDDEHPFGSPNVDPWANPNEFPVHEVTLDPFFISKYEMTQGQWMRFTGNNPSHLSPEAYPDKTLRHPVEQVSWEDCQETLRRLGLRLPTEAQWEYACRAGTTTPFHTGETVASLAGFANIGDEAKMLTPGPSEGFEAGFLDGIEATSAVGTLRANAFGLHDMHGNVGEWCLDGYGTYERPVRPGDGLRLQPLTTDHLTRGGEFVSEADHARSATRLWGIASSRMPFLGVRPARLLER